MADDDERVAAATQWHAASMDDTMDWDGFTAWLEADPRNRACYDQVVMIGALIDRHRDALAPEGIDLAPDTTIDHPRERPRHGRRWAAGFGLMAATLVAVIGVQRLAPRPDRVFATAASSRTIALDPGSTVTLAPRSRLVISDGDATRVQLAGGAYFDVRHDPSRALRIAAGPVTISDIGTRFDIQVADDAVRIGVGEGQVRVRGSSLAQPLTLETGHALLFNARQGVAITRDVAAPAIGGWRSGQLSYDHVPLALVAADLGRYAGVAVAVSDDIRDKPFTGTLAIGDEQAAIQDLARLMGLELARDAGGYRLRPARK